MENEQNQSFENLDPVVVTAEDVAKAPKKVSRRRKKEEKNKLRLSVGDWLIFGILMVLAIATALILNHVYLSDTKYTNLMTNGDRKVYYVNQNTETVQKMTAPSRRVTTFKLYVEENSENPTDKPLYIKLFDEDLSTIKTWQFDTSNLKDDDNGRYIDLDLEGVKLYEDMDYFFEAYNGYDEESVLGIVTYYEARNGYGPSSNDGYIWSMQIGYKPMTVVVYIIEAFCLLLVLLTFFMLKAGENHAPIQAITFFILSLIMFIVTPVNAVKNENYSFYRSYDISSGKLVERPDEEGRIKTQIPDSYLKGMNNVTETYEGGVGSLMYKRTSDFMGRRVGNDDTLQAVLVGTASKTSPLAYGLQALGLLLGRQVSTNLMLVYYYGRIFPFVVSLFLIIIGMDIAKKESRIVMLFGLLPMVISTVVSYNPVGITMAYACFYVSYVKRLGAKEYLETKHKVGLIITSAILGFLSVYLLPISLLVIFISNKKFVEKTQAIIFKAASILSAVIFAVICLIICGGVPDLFNLKMPLIPVVNVWVTILILLMIIYEIAFCIITGFKFRNNLEDDPEYDKSGIVTIVHRNTLIVTSLAIILTMWTIIGQYYIYI